MLRNITKRSITTTGTRFSRYSFNISSRSASTSTNNENNSNPNLKWFMLGAAGLGGIYLWKKSAQGNPKHSASNSSRDGKNTTTKETPGGQTSVKKEALTTASSIAQGFSPVNSIHLNVCGIHHYAGDIKRQVEAHHYCSHVNEDVHQCVIYDSSQPTARLIGVEYIISEELFNQLPEEEKQYWHSHQYEIKSGLLVAPGIPDDAEKELMDHLLNTYGKTFHTWQIDRDNLPLGPPQLMMSFLEDGELDEDLIAKRDKEMGIDTKRKREERSHLKPNKVADGADVYHNSVPDFYSSEHKAKHSKISLPKDSSESEKSAGDGSFAVVEKAKDLKDTAVDKTKNLLGKTKEDAEDTAESLKDKIERKVTDAKDYLTGTEEPSKGTAKAVHRDNNWYGKDGQVGKQVKLRTDEDTTKTKNTNEYASKKAEKGKKDSKEPKDYPQKDKKDKQIIDEELRDMSGDHAKKYMTIKAEKANTREPYVKKQAEEEKKIRKEEKEGNSKKGKKLGKGIKEDAKDTAEDAKEYVSDKAEKAKKKGKGIKEEAKETAEDAKEYVSDKAEKAKKKGKELKDAAIDKKDEIVDKMTKE